MSESRIETWTTALRSAGPAARRSTSELAIWPLCWLAGGWEAVACLALLGLATVFAMASRTVRKKPAGNLTEPLPSSLVDVVVDWQPAAEQEEQPFPKGEADV